MSLFEKIRVVIKEEDAKNPKKSKAQNYSDKINKQNKNRKEFKFDPKSKERQTFRSASCSAKSPLKKIYPIKISKVSEVIKIRISSKSFLQNQVRSMVGSLSYLAKKKWNLQEFKKIFKSKKRDLCAPPAPACGLYLKSVKY